MIETPVRRLGDYVEVKTGKLDANASCEDGQYPFFTCAKEPLRISSYSYDCDCVLVAGNGDLNVKHYKGKFDAYQRTYIVESIDKSVLDSRYLFAFLDKYVEKLRHLSIGGVIKYIKIANLTEAPIPLPCLPEQRRIAAILDQANALRAKRREALAQLDSLTQSIFIEMFGNPSRNPKSWPETALSKLVREGDSINYGVVQPGDALDEGIPLVRVGDLVDGEFSSTTLKRIDPIIESAYKRSRLRGDEILVSCVGSIGVTVLATLAMKGFNIARAVARIPLADRANRIFIASYLRTDAVQNYFTAALRTVAQPTLNIKQIAETKVFCPPLALQENFATRIQAVESLKTTHRAALAELEALFASLQHRAFAGQLS